MQVAAATVSSVVAIQPQLKQDCSRCRHIFKCRNRRTAHDRPLSDRNDMINLLVCRLKLGVNINESAKTLLHLFRPGMVNLVASARRKTGGASIDFDDMLMDMQSFAVESILIKYRIGELNPITNFLFDIKSGYLVKWSQWYVTKAQRFSSRHTLAGSNPLFDGECADDNEDSQHQDDNYTNVDFDSVGGRGVMEAARSNVIDSAMDVFRHTEKRTLADDVMAIIEDGVTLNANEYRVFKFCLLNANDGNDIRMIDGLHIHLARMMGVSRPRVTRLYKRSRDKIIQSINEGT
jgi:hypothetical protein